MSEEKIDSYKDLRVWKESIILCKLVYQQTKVFPSDEQHGLISQMRRSSVSISSNIAEGNNRMGDKEFIRFLRIAYGSLSELETQSLIAHEVGLQSKKSHDLLEKQSTIVSKMIFGLQRSLQKKLDS